MSTSLAAPSPTTTNATPSWAITLHDGILSSAPARRLDVIAAFFGCVPPSELPRPGDVVSYNLQQWRDLAVRLGMFEDEQTKHAHVFRHRILRRVVIAPAGTTGDFRSQMNCLSDFRLSYKMELSKLLTLSEMFLTDFKRDVQASSSDEFRVLMLAAIEKDEVFRQPEANKARKRLGLVVPLADVTKYLKIIKTEFNQSSRQVLEALWLDSEQLQQLLIYVSNERMLGCVDVSIEVFEGVKDLLETLRKNERMQKEQKRAEREQRHAQKPPPPPAAAPLTPRQLFDQAGRRHAEALKAQQDIVSEALKRMAAIPLPPFPRADEEAVKAAQAERDAVIADRIETEAELQDTLNKVESLQQMLIESEATNPWESRMRQLVQKLSEKLADNDITKLIFNLDESRKLLAEAALLLDPPRPAEEKAA